MINALTWGIMALFTGPLLLAQNASQSIADSLVLVTGGVSVFRTAELILFRADGTYQVIFSQGDLNQAIGLQTIPSDSGTYTYNATPGESRFNGTISLSSNSSLINPYVIVIGATGDIEYPTVATVFPQSALTGAVNVSNNCWVSAAHPSISGFVIQGSKPRWVLVRGDGPSLSQFAVANPVSNLTMTISEVPANGNIANERAMNLENVAAQQIGTSTVDSWSSDPNLLPGFQAIFSLAGAFPFPSGSADCAALVYLSPGAYILTASTNGSAGELLTEVYVLPYDY